MLDKNLVRQAGRSPLTWWLRFPKNIHIEGSAAIQSRFFPPFAATPHAEAIMPATVIRAHKSKTKARPYKVIKVQTTDGRASTVSLDKNLYEVIEGKIGAKATITVARQAARQFDPAETDKTRSAYVVQALRSTLNIRAKRPTPSRYTYAKLRVHDAQGNVTTVSLPPVLMARVRRKLTKEQIQAIAAEVAAAYDQAAIFTRSECIQRALKLRLGEKVPSEIQVFRRKFRLTNAQLASILKVSPEELARWEEHDKIDSGPARMMLAMLWREQLKLSAVFKRGQPA